MSIEVSRRVRSWSGGPSHSAGLIRLPPVPALAPPPLEPPPPFPPARPPAALAPPLAKAPARPPLALSPPALLPARAQPTPEHCSSREDFPPHAVNAKTASASAQLRDAPDRLALLSWSPAFGRSRCSSVPASTTLRGYSRTSQAALSVAIGRRGNPPPCSSFFRRMSRAFWEQTHKFARSVRRASAFRLCARLCRSKRTGTARRTRKRVAWSAG
jgi:hypothetical protein